MKITLLFLCYTLSTNILFAQVKEQLKTEIDKIIYFDTDLDFKKTPGYVIGVMIEDSTFVYNYGKTEKEAGNAPSDQTIFEIGSITKVFTSSLVQLLVDEGTLHYDSTLNFYLKEENRNETGDHITILDLVSHNTTLPKLPLEFGLKEKEDNNPYAHYTKSDLMKFYREFIIEKDRDKKLPYIYSHVNYGLLEQVIENVTGKKYIDLVHEKILNPIGLNDTKFELTQDDLPRLSKGYSMSGKETAPWKFQSFYASQGLKSTINDLLDFIKVNMGIKNPKLYESFSKTHDIVMKSGLTKNTMVGKGWHVIKNKKYHNILVHTGSTNGHRAFVGYVKETKTAVVIISNSEFGMSGLGFLILRMINNNWKKKR